MTRRDAESEAEIGVERGARAEWRGAWKVDLQVDEKMRQVEQRVGCTVENVLESGMEIWGWRSGLASFACWVWKRRAERTGKCTGELIEAESGPDNADWAGRVIGKWREMDRDRRGSKMNIRVESGMECGWKVGW